MKKNFDITEGDLNYDAKREQSSIMFNNTLMNNTLANGVGVNNATTVQNSQVC